MLNRRVDRTFSPEHNPRSRPLSRVGRTVLELRSTLFNRARGTRGPRCGSRIKAIRRDNAGRDRHAGSRAQAGETFVKAHPSGRGWAPIHRRRQTIVGWASRCGWVPTMSLAGSRLFWPAVRRPWHGVARPRSFYPRRSEWTRQRARMKQLSRAKGWRSWLALGRRRSARFPGGSAFCHAAPASFVGARLGFAPARAASASPPAPHARRPDASGQLAWAKRRFPPDWVVSVPLLQAVLRRAAVRLAEAR